MRDLRRSNAGIRLHVYRITSYIGRMLSKLLQRLACNVLKIRVSLQLDFTGEMGVLYASALYCSSAFTARFVPSVGPIASLGSGIEVDDRNRNTVTPVTPEILLEECSIPARDYKRQHAPQVAEAEVRGARRRTITPALSVEYIAMLIALPSHEHC